MVRRRWESYPDSYRARELKTVAGWISAGESGTVAGPGGSGKSNFLNFLCHRPEIIRRILSSEIGPLALVPVDLNSLPTNNLSSLHRLILRAFYDIRPRLSHGLAGEAEKLYLTHRTERDPFLTQCALRDLLGLFQEQRGYVVLVFDRFDHFYQIASPTMLNTLRSLRDSYKDTLSYIVGMRTEVAYLAEPDDLGEMRELLDRFVCWIGSMTGSDARHVIKELTETSARQPAEADTDALLALTGGYPALLKAVCYWWQAHGESLPRSEWPQRLLAEPMIQYRLEEIWDGLTQAEQLALTELQRLLIRTGDNAEPEPVGPAFQQLAQQYGHALDRLVEKQLCQPDANGGWRIGSTLLAAYVASLKDHHPRQKGRGKIWWDSKTDQFCQGEASLPELTPLERAVLLFFIKYTDTPGKFYPRTEIMSIAWPDEAEHEPTDPRLDQVIGKLRRKIEPDPPNYRYIITRRGRQHKNTQGGYYFYPEGKQKT